MGVCACVFLNSGFGTNTILILLYTLNVYAVAFAYVSYVSYAHLHHFRRPAHWYTNMFEVRSLHQQEQRQHQSILMFEKGGFQGAEGVVEGEGWYIENVLAELDSEREWYYDSSEQLLIYKPNITDAAAVRQDPKSGLLTPTGYFVATNLKVLFNITGTKAFPAQHVAIRGVTLRDTAYTYLDPHGLPSGGDWALQKQGAVTLVGTKSISIEDCLLTRLDGNAIFIGGYNRNMSIARNVFSYIGDSAMAAWGDTSANLNGNGTLTVPGGYKVGPDGRGGEQPRGTVVRSNIAHDIGIWQKQSSMWFQAITTQTVLHNNIFCKVPPSFVLSFVFCPFVSFSFLSFRIRRHCRV